MIIIFKLKAQESVVSPTLNNLSSLTPDLRSMYDLPKSATAINLITPRILELDINRVMYPQHLIT